VADDSHSHTVATLDVTSADVVALEGDPWYNVSASYNITQTMIGNWNTSYGWGNPALTYMPFATFNGTAAKNLTITMMGNWNTSYGWGDHALEGYLTAEDDPQVGTLTNLKWCSANGTAINCDNDAPAGAGDMTKLVYDPADNGIVDNAENVTCTGCVNATELEDTYLEAEVDPDYNAEKPDQVLNITSDVVFNKVNATLFGNGGNITGVTADLNYALYFSITNGTSVASTGWYCCARAMNSFTAGAWEISSTDGTATTSQVVVKKFDVPAGANQAFSEANFTNTSGTEPPTITNAQYNEDVSLGSFNTTIVAGEYYGFNLTANNNSKTLNIIIRE
jgi:hypothetical protein